MQLQRTGGYVMSFDENLLELYASPLKRFLFLVLIVALCGLAAGEARAQESVATEASDVAVTGLPRAAAADSTPAPTAPAGSMATPAPAESHRDSSATMGEPERITQSEYMQGGSPLHTMTGKLPYRQTHVSTSTISIFGGGLVALATGITWYQQKWYPDSTKGPFNFQQDIGYSKELDKFGHAFGGYMASYCSNEALIASGFSKEDAAIWGAACGLFFQTFIEVQDGFHKNYGFDWTDEVANVVGISAFYIQKQVPFFQNFDYKWSFGPSGRDSARNAAQIRSRLIVDDYDGQNIWLSARVHNLLPESLKSYWPKWLQLAVGYGAKDVELRGYTAYRTMYIALDYNLVELLPDMGPFMNWLVQGLDKFRFPAPALQIMPDVRFKLLYPFDL
jgi:hypothetical protein